MPVVKFMVRLFKSAVGTTDVLSLLQSFSLLWFNILRKFRAIALHYPLCSVVPTELNAKMRIKKAGNLGCFVCPLPVFFAQLPTIFGRVQYFNLVILSDKIIVVELEFKT